MALASLLASRRTDDDPHMTSLRKELIGEADRPPSASAS
jgi:hypothetical protein